MASDTQEDSSLNPSAVQDRHQPTIWLFGGGAAPPLERHAGPATALEPFPALAGSDVPTQLYVSGGDDMPAEDLVQSWFYSSPAGQPDSQPASAPRQLQALPILGSSSVERPVTPADSLASLPKPPALTGLQGDVKAEETAGEVGVPHEGVPDDKENVTPPVAAPSRKKRDSTKGSDKRKPESGGSRCVETFLLAPHSPAPQMLALTTSLLVPAP